MLNYIWAVMIAIGVIYGALTGNIEAVANGALDSAGEAVQLCITMTGIMALWVGLMEIAKNSGLIASMTKGIQPFISFLFPRIPGEPCGEGIYFHQYYRQYPGAGLGLHSGRAESHGRAAEAE